MYRNRILEEMSLGSLMTSKHLGKRAHFLLWVAWEESGRRHNHLHPTTINKGPKKRKSSNSMVCFVMASMLNEWPFHKYLKTDNIWYHSTKEDTHEMKGNGQIFGKIVTSKIIISVRWFSIRRKRKTALSFVMVNNAWLQSALPFQPFARSASSTNRTNYLQNWMIFCSQVSMDWRISAEIARQWRIIKMGNILASFG